LLKVSYYQVIVTEPSVSVVLVLLFRTLVWFDPLFIDPPPAPQYGDTLEPTPPLYPPAPAPYVFVTPPPPPKPPPITIPTQTLWGCEDGWIAVSNANFFNKLIENTRIDIMQKIDYIPV
jgi:hypothetical protein